MFQAKIGIAPEMMRKIYQIEDKTCNFRHLRHLKTVNYGTYTTSFVGNRIWNTITKSVSTNSLKENIEIRFLLTALIEYAKSMLKTITSII